MPVQKLGDETFTVLRYYRYHRIVAHDILLSPSVEELFANTARAKDICSRCGRPYFLSGVAHLEEARRSNNNQNLIQAENDFNEVSKELNHQTHDKEFQAKLDIIYAETASWNGKLLFNG